MIDDDGLLTDADLLIARALTPPFALCVMCGRRIETENDWGKHGSPGEYYCRRCAGIESEPRGGRIRGTNRTPAKKRRRKRR